MNRGRNQNRSKADGSSIYTELHPGAPIVEVCGQNRVLIENHQGIVGYGCNEIHIKVRFGRIGICGENLKLKQMSKSKLVVSGRICTVNLQGRG